MFLPQKDYTFPAKRLVFEDMNAAAGGDAEKIKTLTAENKDLKNRVLVALADVENMRQRTKKSAEEDKKFAVRSFAKGPFCVPLCVPLCLFLFGCDACLSLSSARRAPTPPHAIGIQPSGSEAIFPVVG